MESRPYFVQRGISLLLTLILTIFTLIAIGLIIFGQMGMEYLLEEGWIEGGLVKFSLNMGRWVVILTLMFFAISVLYFLGPAKQTKWRFFSAGSTLATLLVLITSLGFSFFVESFGQYNQLYGSIGTLVIVMLWMFFNSIALLIGFELNASIEDAKLRDMELNKRTLDISLEEEIIKGGQP
jgi:membrane protein